MTMDLMGMRNILAMDTGDLVMYESVQGAPAPEAGMSTDPTVKAAYEKIASEASNGIEQEQAESTAAAEAATTATTSTSSDEGESVGDEIEDVFEDIGEFMCGSGAHEDDDI